MWSRRKPKRSTVARTAPRHPPAPEAELKRVVYDLSSTLYEFSGIDDHPDISPKKEKHTHLIYLALLTTLLYHSKFWKALNRASVAAARDVRKQVITTLDLPATFDPELSDISTGMASELFRKTEEHLCKESSLKQMMAMVALIYGDYVGKMFHKSQLRAGVTEYMWLTRRDERVRPAHRALDGKVYAWSDPPPLKADVSTNGLDCYPGEDINCRCVPAPIKKLTR